MKNLKFTLLISISMLCSIFISKAHELSNITATAGNGKITVTFRGYIFAKKYRAYYSNNQNITAQSTPKVEMINPCTTGACAENLITIEINNLQNGMPYFLRLSYTYPEGPEATITESPLTDMSYAIPITPTMVYVPNFNSSNVSQFKLDPSTGNMTPAENAMVSGLSQAQWMTLAGTNYAYMVSPSGNKLIMYNILNGNLQPQQPTLNGEGSTGIIADKSGSSVYITNAASQQISAYAVGSDGNLNHLEDHNTGINPQTFALTPNNKFLYVFNYSSNTIAAFTRDPITFKLQRIKDVKKNPISYPCGVNPAFGITDPSGKYLYVACNSNDANNNNVYKFTIGVDGTLSGMIGYTSGNTPAEIYTDQSGKFLYVVNAFSNNIQLFNIDSNNGNIAAAANGSYNTGQNPSGIAVSPLGDFLYVVNSGDNTITRFNKNMNDGILSNPTTISNGVGNSPQQMLVNGLPSPRAPKAGEVYTYKTTINISNPDPNATKYIAFFKSDSSVSPTQYDRIEVFSGSIFSPTWTTIGTNTYMVIQAINKNGVSATSPYFNLRFQ